MGVLLELLLSSYDVKRTRDFRLLQSYCAISVIGNEKCHISSG